MSRRRRPQSTAQRSGGGLERRSKGAVEECLTGHSEKSGLCADDELENNGLYF